MICLQIGKTYTAKTPPGNFKVTTPKNLLLSKQVVTNKGISIPYTNLQLNPYPNTQLNLFCSDNLSFQCTVPSTWLTNCTDPSTQFQSPTREGCWLQSSSIYHTMKIKKLFGHKTLWCIKHSSFFTRKMNWGKFCLWSQFAWKRLCLTLMQLVTPLMALKIILIYV